MKRASKLVLAGAASGAAAAIYSQLARRRVEQPVFVRLARYGPIEIRRYEPRVLAETEIEGDFSAAQSAGFRRLAAYIFGGNTGAARIGMTTPVTTGKRIPMTAPVEQSVAGERRVMTFTMPARYGLRQLPTPNDSRVRLRQLPGMTMAALRFSGRADPESTEAHTRELLEALRPHGVAMGEPLLAQYDPPWVIGPLRRNEILVPLLVPVTRGSPLPG